jgi:hypothetical protein
LGRSFMFQHLRKERTGRGRPNAPLRFLHDGDASSLAMFPKAHPIFRLTASLTSAQSKGPLMLPPPQLTAFLGPLNQATKGRGGCDKCGVKCFVMGDVSMKIFSKEQRQCIARGPAKPKEAAHQDRVYLMKREAIIVKT